MKNILYLNNFMSEDIVKKRKNKAIFSQPANNKVTGILDSLMANGCNVSILSSGLVNGKSIKWYKREVGEQYHGADVVYCGIWDVPLLNTITSIICMYREIVRQQKERKVDHIIFYNYKPEVAWAAYFAKKFLHIPITIEYEDGYAHVPGMGKFKAWLFNATEDKVSKKVDSGILVTSLLKEKYSVPCAVVRGVVNASFYSRCQAYVKKPNSKFTILYSGGLDESRGIGVLMRALEYMSFDCKVIVTGKGKMDVQDSRIDFKGFISYDEVQQLMMQADALVQCQLTNCSFGSASFPSKLFEYIATGNYIVSSDVSDVKDFAGDRIQYYYNDDPKQLAAELEKAYDAWNKGAVKSNAVVELCANHLPDQVGGRIIEILNKEE